MKIGKSEARARFLPLIQEVSSGAGPVEITDRGQVAAVLMSHQDYLLLLARAHDFPKARMSPVGTMEIVGDLEQASRELTRSTLESIFRSADDL